MDENGTKFNPKKTKCKRFCSVYGCSSKACKDSEIRFHSFPPLEKNFVKRINERGVEEIIDRRKLWKQVLKMGKKISPSMCVCSLHFKSEDYLQPTTDQLGKRYLKVTAVPSCNLPVSTIDTKKFKLKSDSKREERKLMREKKSIEITKSQFENSVTNLSATKTKGKDNGNIANYFENNAENVQEKELEIINKSSLDSTDINSSEIKGKEIEPENIAIDNYEINNVKAIQEKGLGIRNKSCLVDVGIQVKSGDLIDPNFSSFIKTDKELSTTTGIPNLEMLNTFIKIFERVAPKCAYYTGKLTIRDRIILTFMRLKQNNSYAFLNVLFKNCTERHISNVIRDTLDILSEGLKYAIVLPVKQEILRNVPFCFQEYADVSLILDCTEIEIQNPKKLCCQLATYSFYKSRNTIKFLTACTPGGLLAYVSPAYGGRSTDKAIFEQSGIINYLEKDEKIMVDKGFLIDDICVQNGIKIVRPPFLRNKKQFSQEEALNTASIAKARVHVERLNQRLKVFQILGSKMPSCLVKKADQIMTVLAAVVNLSSPILSDDKFPS